uniref:monogalactosyldiacylglycerol synthase n=1 Tax=Haptolina brevifila TaxID=156173 RepID=A0A7S2GPJ2_9EUKA
MVDMFVESGRWPFSDYPAIYKDLAAVPWLWKLVAFDLGASPIGIFGYDLLMDVICRTKFRQLLEASPRPDLVVSVHPLLQHVPLLALTDADGGTRTTPFATVVTDLGSAHPSWFDSRVDRCYVPSEALRVQAKGRGLNAEQIVQHGLPIRRGFWKESSTMDGLDDGSVAASTEKEKWRSELGLVAGVPTVLVVGGGDGMGGLVGAAQAIGRGLGEGRGRPDESQLVVICGRNSDAVASLEKALWPSNVHVSVRGFVSNMDEWMAASDLLVTKAGPGTIAEASVMGLPCVLNSFLPGQESGNVDFVREMGFGEYSSDPEEVAALVVQYLGDETRLAEMAQAARQAGRPEATQSIARGLARMLGEELST